MKETELVAYTHAYLSYILPRVKTKIREIILFGSVARGDFDQDSDIDLFFDVLNENDALLLKKELKLFDPKFYESKIYEIWKQKGFTNRISAKVGILDQWELRGSVLAEGITLQAKYHRGLPGEGYMLLSFSPIRDITKRNRITRALFGREEKGFKKDGMVSKVGGRRISPTVFLVPLQFSREIISFLRKEKVDIELREIWGLEKL